MIIRGISAVRPGHDKASENITVTSVVGRFLEHSRLFYFENAGAPLVYIGSSDMMRRNLDRRIEVLTPVHSLPLIEYLREVLIDSYLRDTANAWVEQPDGTYKRRQSEGSFSAQEYLMKHPATRMLLPCEED